MPALLPGLLLALHYAVQIVRPRMGHGADLGRRCTPWMAGGMLTLAAGGWLATLATVLMGTHMTVGIALACVAYVLIGLGVAACGTSLLVLLAKRVPAGSQAASATTVWIMMIAGFVVTAGVSGTWLEPYSPQRLLGVASGVVVGAVLLTLLALAGLEGPIATIGAGSAPPERHFRRALAEVWAEPQSRRFTVFVAVSMLAYSAQDLILEPFAGMVFGLTPGGSTRLSGVQHGGALVGMLLAAVAGSEWAGRSFGSLRQWTVGGCIASALTLAGLACAGVVGPAWPLRANVFLLGLTTGAFSIAAIGSMMRLAHEGAGEKEGMRMGLWGAAQAIAFATGGLLGTAASDLARRWLADTGTAYALVFALEAVLFFWAAQLAANAAPDAAPGAGADRATTPRRASAIAFVATLRHPSKLGRTP